MTSKFRLIIQKGPTPGKVFDLTLPELTVGRDLSNDIVINDSEVSRRHARLTQQEESYNLEDLHSTNGTAVNQIRLLGRVTLKHGDLISFGKTVVLGYERSDEAPLDEAIVQANNTMLWESVPPAMGTETKDSVTSPSENLFVNSESLAQNASSQPDEPIVSTPPIFQAETPTQNAQKPAPATQTSTSPSIKLAEQFFVELIGKASWGLAWQILAENIVVHHPVNEVPITGREDVARFLASLRISFPDIEVVIQNAFGDEHQVAVRWQMNGTNSGALLGHPPTGKRATWSGISILSVQNNEITEIWMLQDLLTISRQLGMRLAA